MDGRPSTAGRPGLGLIQRFLILLAGVVFAVLAPVPVASAHPTLRVTDPVTGSTLTTLEAVQLNFDESLQPDKCSFRLLSATGSFIGLRTPVLEEEQTRVRLAPDTKLAAGLYRVIYEVVGPDGHPISGRLQFEISPDGLPRAGPWPDDLDDQGTTPSAAASPVGALSAERFANDPVLPLAVGLGLVLLLLAGAYGVRAVRAGHR